MRAVRDAFERLLRDATLVTIALAIALGWALFQVAEGLSAVFTTLLTEYPSEAGAAHTFFEPLTWNVRDRVLTLGPLLRGLIELAAVLSLALLLSRKGERSR
jgi:predicted anti-sigma-YlaC factor YlaD